MITVQDIIKMVRLVAAERPDYVYEPTNCVYFDTTDEPRCIVGQALDRLGINPHRYPPYLFEGTVAHMLDNLAAEGIISNVIPALDIAWLTAVQTLQDGSMTFDSLGNRTVLKSTRVSWGEAVRRADENRP